MAKNILLIAILLTVLIGGCLVFGDKFGWLGVLGVTTIFIAICFFVFYRSMRLMSTIQSTPEGRTVHAEFFHRHIAVGMSLIKIIQIAQALGHKISTDPDVYTWQDQHNKVTVTAKDMKATHIEISPLEEAKEETEATEAPAAS